MTNCFASHHLTMEESALLDVCLRLTCGGMKPLHFDGRTMGERFSPKVCRQRIYRIAKQLEAKGWLRKTAGGFRSRGLGGKYTHMVYKVYDHAEWATKHPKGGCKTVSCSEHGDDSTVITTRHGGDSTVITTRHGGDSTVITTRTSPSSPRGHSSVKSFGVPRKALLTETQKAVNQERSDDVCSAVITTGHGEYTVPPFAEYDTAEREWRARRGLGRGTTPDEVKEIHRLNREHVQPSIQ